MGMRLVVAADHAGFVLKANLLPWLDSCGVEYEDKGARVYEAGDDYPAYAELVALDVGSGKAEKGLLICGSGVGAAIAANKFPGVRACLCHDTYSAHQGVEHDDMNVLCLGSRVVGIELAKELISAFLGARFLAEERFSRRLEQVKEIENRYFKSPRI